MHKDIADSGPNLLGLRVHTDGRDPGLLRRVFGGIVKREADCGSRAIQSEAWATMEAVAAVREVVAEVVGKVAACVAGARRLVAWGSNWGPPGAMPLAPSLSPRRISRAVL